MSVFFNGRLWVSPATMSVVDDSAMANRNLAVGNVIAFIGPSEGGEPNTILKFGSPSQAQAVLRGGLLLNAVEKAFDPSSQTNGPSTVVAIRVNPATQSSLVLEDSTGEVASNVIGLTSTDYGLSTQQIKVKIESGTLSGKKLSTQLGNDFYTEDNVSRDVLSVQYTGPLPTATLTVTNNTVTFNTSEGELPANGPGEVVPIDLVIYNTVQKLVDRLNAITGVLAAVLNGQGEKITLGGLDSIIAQGVSLPYTVTADLQAIVDWFNGISEGFVNATRFPGAGTLPDNMDFTYLGGGSNGITTNQSWADAFTTLQTEDVQWVVPINATAAIHAMADSHCSYMSNIARLERRALVGGGEGQTQTDVKAAALALNSDRTSVCYPGYYDYDAQGNLVLYPAYMTAALVGAAFAGSNPGTALTNKAIKVRGLELKLRNPTDTDDLIKAGVLCVEETTRGYKVVKSISTWLNNANYNRVEVSTGFAMDFVARSVRDALDDLRGQKGSPVSLSEAVSRADSVLRELARPEPSGPGVIVGDENNPAYKNITATLNGDVLRVEFQASPVIPINYIPITIHAVPFSGSRAVA